MSGNFPSNCIYQFPSISFPQIFAEQQHQRTPSRNICEFKKIGKIVSFVKYSISFTPFTEISLSKRKVEKKIKKMKNFFAKKFHFGSGGRETVNVSASYTIRIIPMEASQKVLLIEF